MHFSRLALLVLGVVMVGAATRALGGCVGDAPVPNTTLDSGADVATPPDASGDAGIPEVPTTCNEAAQSHGYIGCDFWPVILPSPVFVEFDFAVVVANPGDTAADVTVTGPGLSTPQKTQVLPNQVAKIFLPWEATLKGPEGDRSNGQAPPLPVTSLRVPNGAFHLVSTAPIAAYQFNPLEYHGVGGPPGKDWSTCPKLGALDCNSYTNDASLLLPSTSWQKHTRLLGPRSATAGGAGSYTGIVATEATNVTVNTSSTSSVNSGTSIAATGPSAVLNFSMAAGEVVVLTVPLGGDLSGSLVVGDKPLEVFTGSQCQTQPLGGGGSCDHLEEVVPPAQALGKTYVVVPPAPPAGGGPGHVLRFVGNANGALLSYNPSKPTGCPASLNAGEVVECGVVTEPFVVTGDKEFGIVTLMLRSSLDAGNIGDPSQSIMVPVEQHRSKYVFMAPDDFAPSFADVVCQSGTSIALDGTPVGGLIQIGTTGFSYAHVSLSASGTGRHLLVSDKPVGVQVIGYGFAASYEYPGGANVLPISPVPTP